MPATATTLRGWRFRVPSEFIGRARVFCESVSDDEAAVATVADRILAPLKARFRRHATPRKTLCQDVARQWREELPQFGRLGLSVQMYDGLRIVDLRMAPCKLKYPGWDCHEPSVSLTLLTVLFVKGKLSIDRQVVATVGLHGLARWYERRRGTDDELYNDLRPLFMARQFVLDTSKPKNGFNFGDAAGEGRWLGNVVSVNDDGKSVPILSVRTFALARG